ncbi:DUF6197 family protein [Phytohabitans rumicis]|uniref:Uncharacterized protein n=1 Tax=Phytohabitans rumicis TaxID=1076125 RepID=A0A6V8L172_9ACTN|nr:hypothetical protein [Phytohabitans rumicis]GFJ87847.1 hypothetical protein Prum_014890 [Phytohabitans rumicis]
MKPTQKQSTNVNGPRPPRLAGLLGITVEHISATADVTEATPAVILRGAALYLQRHGWHQGSLYADDRTNPTPAACIQGGIGMAAFGQRIPADAMEHNHRAEWRDYQRASNFFSDYLTMTGAKPGPTDDQEDWEGPTVGDWNDEPGRPYPKSTPRSSALPTNTSAPTHRSRS